MAHLIPIFLFALSSLLTPGPNNIMVMSSGLNFGVKRSLPHYLGICLGFPAMVLVVALGFGAIFVKYHWLKEILKYVGSAYMLYLAWRIYTSSQEGKVDVEEKPLSFLQAAIFQWVNPKAWLMVVGAISIFSIAHGYLANALGFTLIFLLFTFPSGAAWLVGGAFLQKVLKEDKHRKIFNAVMALFLVASVALILFE